MLTRAITFPPDAHPSPQRRRVERARLAAQQLSIDDEAVGWEAMVNALVASRMGMVQLGGRVLQLVALGILEHLTFGTYVIERPNSAPFSWFRLLTGAPEHFTPKQIDHFNASWLETLHGGLTPGLASVISSLGWRTTMSLSLMWLCHELVVGALLWFLVLGLTDKRSIWRPALGDTPVAPALDLVDRCWGAFQAPLGARGQEIAAVEDAAELLARALDATARHGGGMTNRRTQRATMRAHARKVIASLHAVEGDLYIGPDAAIRKIAQLGVWIADRHATGRVCDLLPVEELTVADSDRLEGRQWTVTLGVALVLALMVCVPAMWLLKMPEKFALATMFAIVLTVASWRHGTRGSERLLARLRGAIPSSSSDSNA